MDKNSEGDQGLRPPAGKPRSNGLLWKLGLYRPLRLGAGSASLQGHISEGRPSGLRKRCWAVKPTSGREETFVSEGQEKSSRLHVFQSRLSEQGARVRGDCPRRLEPRAAPRRRVGERTPRTREGSSALAEMGVNRAFGGRARLPTLCAP